MSKVTRLKPAARVEPLAKAAGLPRNLEITELKNGLTVITDRMDYLESAALGVWVKAGSRDEASHEHGIAHVLEHMAFKGTSGRRAQDIATQIENVGGDVNAATSVETTSYYARVLKNDVPLAVDILGDILTESLFDEGELKREQHVILQEIGAAQDSPEDVVFDQFQSTAFSDQALGRPIMGTPETVSSFAPDHIRSYLSDHYHGPNMVLAASGAVDHDEIVKLAEKRLESFGDTPTKEPEAGHYSGGEFRQSKDLMEAQILLGFEGRAYHARDFYASQVLAMLLGGGMSSRLFQEVREKRGLCYSIYAFHWGYSDTGTFGIHAATEEADVSELMPVLLDELRHASGNITQEALDRARAQISAGLLMSLESPASRAGQIARQMLLFGRPVSNEELMERLNALTIERLGDLAQRMFTQSDLTVAAIGPIGNLPEHAELSGILKG
ncbi:M16 family metallopeptidase [Pseudahrensia aquimaris]|uniref:M16 family metallopeptidase n=1 Tax=Pseudahrensia aquimaris TaxID=744461 RepID=A0ABW3FBT9_9HYPH